ncbi:OFA family MFS transporter [Desulfovibrio sp. PG-178-WT-4]|uniref:OFA family MFS transporter n=1 Tax=Desulfovibrio porci TaxID=2605782 RepID=A0A6L5XJS4_9BACT|nr:OFA family MFS transporter [Desulfovibrio porci]
MRLLSDGLYPGKMAAVPHLWPHVRLRRGSDLSSARGARPQMVARSQSAGHGRHRSGIGHRLFADGSGIQLDHRKPQLALRLPLLRRHHGPHFLPAGPSAHRAAGRLVAARTDADQSGANGKPARYRDYTYEESIRSGQFWLLYLTYFFTASAGLLVTGHIAAFGTDSGLTPGLAAGAVMALTITNAATRVGSGYFADRFGSKRYFTIISLIQGVALGALYYTGSSPALLWLTAAVIGWNYGAIFTLFPALCVQFFGSGAQNSNYGLLFTAWGIAGFFGPFSGGFLRDMTGTYITPFIMASALGFLALILVLINRPPAPKEA